MKNLFVFLMLSFLLFPLISSAETSNLELMQSYKSMKYLASVDIQVPTVVELPIDDISSKNANFAVLDIALNKFQPYYFYSLNQDIPVKMDSALSDNNYNTYIEYKLSDEDSGETTILIEADRPVTSSSLIISLDNYVALPNKIEIKVSNGREENVVLAKTKMYGTVINFPKTTAKIWSINLEYSQPLRITELDLIQGSLGQEKNNRLRFLAQPGVDYRIYLNPDRILNVELPESGNLRNDEGVLEIAFIQSENNPIYLEADIDEDGIPDLNDNCVRTENADQVDIDGNNRGDACDDFDRDGLINSIDNCPDQPNSRQEDVDSDGIGDLCDGEESRLTENTPWLPWLAMGLVAIVVAVLFLITFRNE